MRVTELARQLGVTVDTVRFYKRNGFLIPYKNENNGYQDHSQTGLRRLRFIIEARQLGFSVNDIGQLLKEADGGKTLCPLARELIEQRLDEMERHCSEGMAPATGF